MQELVKAIVANVQGNATLSAFAGTAPGGALGPFFSKAPEGTQPPYTVFSIVAGLENWQGFTANYAERAEIRFAVRSSVGLNDAMTKTETFASVYDALTGLTLGGGEICRKPTRINAPIYFMEPVDGTGTRIFNGVLSYRFSVQRARGTI